MQSQGFWKWFDITVSLVMVIAVPVLASGTTFTFTQTNWGGGITADVPTHTDNRSGWTEYTSTSTSMGVMNAGADLQIATSSTSITQTNEGTTNTGFNLSGAAFSTTETMGSGSNTSIRLQESTGFGDSVIVDSLNSRGTYNDIALDQNDKAHISYRYVNAQDLMYATNVSGSWATTTVDNGSQAGFGTSIAVDASGYAHIAYYVNSGDLGYATNAPAGVWSYGVIDAGAGNVGTNQSIVIDANGKAHISYHAYTKGSLDYATNVSGSWATTTIDGTDSTNIGSYSSIDIDSNGKLHISYYITMIPGSFVWNLGYATNASGSWATSTAESNGTVGAYNSLAIDSNNAVHISTQKNATDLIYVTNSSGSWASTTLDASANATGYYTAIAVDSTDHVHITSYDGTDDDLEYATNVSGSWATSTLASVGNVGGQSSIAIDSTDKVHVSYVDETSGDLMYLTEAITYASSGTFTSGPISLGVGALEWGNLSWTETLNGGTITIKARSDADGDFANAADWASCANITNGAAFSTGNCVTNGHTYIQYQATLSTPDTSTTPVLSDVTIGYATYATGQILTSSIFNTQSTTTAIHSLSWIEEAILPENAALVVELRTASTSAGITSSTWYDFNSVTVNCSKTDATVTCPASALPLVMKDVSDDQYFQYRVTLQTNDSANTPTFSEVSVEYTPDAGVGPTVDTNGFSSVTSTSVTLNGAITATGGTDVTTRGFAYGTDSTFATVIATTTDTVGQPFSTGTFTHSLTGLTCGTTYYVRAYATNTAGTGFGFDKAFILTCEESSGGGSVAASRDPEEGGEGTAVPANNQQSPSEAEFHLPIFNHTGRDRRFDPARAAGEPDVSEPTSPTTDAPPDSGGRGNDLTVLTRAVRSIQTVAQETVTLIASTTEQVASAMVPLGALSGTLAFVGTAIPAASGAEFAVSLARLWHLLLSALGFRKRKPWGVVYDSVTKHPIDPATIKLTDQYGTVIDTSYTDLDGRYGFMVPPGTYRIEVAKQNYVFPSKRLQGLLHDDLYQNLYLGGPLTILKGDTLRYNIPLDPVGLDWNEFNEQSYKRFHFYSERDRVLSFVARWVYRFGFLAALYALVTVPTVTNGSIVALYLLIGALRLLGFGPRPYGYLTDEKTGAPLAFALVTIYDAKLRSEVTRVITDHLGKYYALVPEGEYVLKVGRREQDGSYRTIYTSGVVEARRGVVNESMMI